MNFDQLVKEGTKILKTKKKAQVSNRTGVIARNKHELFKKIISEREEQILIGKLERHHIRTIIKVDHCPTCSEITKTVASMQVISKNRAGDQLRVTANITSHGMYQFHYDLPIKIIEHDVWGPNCLECLIEDRDSRELGENRNFMYAEENPYATA